MTLDGEDTSRDATSQAIIRPQPPQTSHDQTYNYYDDMDFD